MNATDRNNFIIQSLQPYQPQKIGIFGSYARHENTINSDIDIFVKFKTALSLLQLIKIENEIAEKIGIKVDLVTEGAITNEKINRNRFRNNLSMNKDDNIYIEHILNCIRKINQFSENVDLDNFRANELIQDAIIRNIEIIGKHQKKFQTIFTKFDFKNRNLKAK